MAVIFTWGALCLAASFVPGLAAAPLPVVLGGAASLAYIAGGEGLAIFRRLLRSPHAYASPLQRRDQEEEISRLRDAEEGRMRMPRRAPVSRAPPARSRAEQPRPQPPPAPPPRHEARLDAEPAGVAAGIAGLDDALLESVFERLAPRERCSAACACREWSRVLAHPRFWTFEAPGLRLSPEELVLGDRFEPRSFPDLLPVLRLGRYSNLRSVRLGASSRAFNARVLSSVCYAAQRYPTRPALRELRARLRPHGAPLAEAVPLAGGLRVLALKVPAREWRDGEAEAVEAGGGSSSSDSELALETSDESSGGEGAPPPPSAGAVAGRAPQLPAARGLEALLRAASGGALETLDLKGFHIAPAAVADLAGLRALRLRCCALQEEALAGLVARSPGLERLAIDRPRGRPPPRHAWAARLPCPAPSHPSGSTCPPPRGPGGTLRRPRLPLPPPLLPPALRTPESARLLGGAPPVLRPGPAPVPRPPAAALAALAGAPHARLAALALDCAPGAGEAALSALLSSPRPALRALALSSDSLTPGLLARLPALYPSLTALAIEDAPNAYPPLPCLAGLGSLRLLSLARCPVGPARPLPALPSLTEASFLRCSGVGRADAPAFGAAWPRLRTLALDDVQPHEYLEALASGARPLPVSSLFLHCSDDHCHLGWALYEGSYRPFYNMTHAFVPVLLRKLAAGVVDENGFVYLGRIPLRPSAWSTTVQTGISIIQIFLFLFISPLADFDKYRKRIWVVCTVMGAIMCIAMVSLADSHLWLAGGLMYIFACCNWGLANVMYNSYLTVLSSVHPGVATEADPELRKAKLAFVNTAMSSHAFAAGFGNTVWLLLIALGLLALHSETDVTGYRAIQGTVGVWWLVGAIPAFLLVKARPGPPTPKIHGLLTDISKRARRVAYLSRRMPTFSVGMIVAFLAGAGAASMTQISNLFADEVLKMTNLEIGLLALEAVICLLSGAAAVVIMIRAFNLSIRATMIISLFSFGVFCAYFVVGMAPDISWGVKSRMEMYVLVGLASLSGGAVLALGRGILSSMLPASLECEFFGYIGVIYNLAGLILPGINTAIINATNNLRLCFLATSVAFTFSGVAMMFVHIEAGVQDAAEVTNDLADHGSLEEVMDAVPMTKWLRRRRSVLVQPPGRAAAAGEEEVPILAETPTTEKSARLKPAAEPVVVYSEAPTLAIDSRSSFAAAAGGGARRLSGAVASSSGASSAGVSSPMQPAALEAADRSSPPGDGIVAMGPDADAPATLLSDPEGTAA
eukprot:tig00020965_g16834.t1